MPTVTITTERGTETLTVAEFRRRRGLVDCRRCNFWHPQGRCPSVQITAARRGTTLGQYTPRRDGIDG